MLSACQWATRAWRRRWLQKISPPLACSLPSTAPLCAGEQWCSQCAPVKAREDKPVPFCTDQAASGVKIAQRKKTGMQTWRIPTFLCLSCCYLRKTAVTKDQKSSFSEILGADIGFATCPGRGAPASCGDTLVQLLKITLQGRRVGK